MTRPRPLSRPWLLSRPRSRLSALVAQAAIAVGLVAGSGAVLAQDAASLQAKQDSMQQALHDSPFGRPLVLQSSGGSERTQGDAYAVLRQPFSTVSEALRRADTWCDVMLLQSNTKRCEAQGQRMQVAVGRKFDQPADNAFQLDFAFAVRAAQPDYLQVQMSAAQGPMGTSDYKLVMEAVPIGEGQTFIHMSYAYASGALARMATDAYLATAGRDKVGFSIAGRDASGQPQFVGGVRGIAERNTMRYYLAIETVLDTLNLPPQQQAEARFKRWFAATERYPRQLREMALDEYLASKKQRNS